MELTTGETSRATGASLRQLQHWHERGFIRIRIEGRRRLWNEAAVRKATVLARIGTNGLQLLERVSKLPDAVFARRFFVFRATESPYTKGRALPRSLVAVTDDPAEVIRISTEARHGVMLVEVPN